MRVTHYLVVALTASALAPACGSHGFGDGNDAGSDSPFVNDVTFGGDSQGNRRLASPPRVRSGDVRPAPAARASGVVHDRREPGQRRPRHAGQLGAAAPPTRVQVALPVRQDGVPARAPPADAAVRRRGARRDATCTSRAPRLDYKGYFGRVEPGARRRSSQPVVGRDHARGDGGRTPVKVEVTKISGGAGQRARSPRPGRSRRAACAAPSTTRRTTRRSSAASASVGIMKIAAGRHAAHADRERLRQRLPHRERGRLDARVARRASPARARATTSRTTRRRSRRRPTESFIYGGLYPDGSFLMSATNYRTWLGDAVAPLRHATRRERPAPGWDGVDHERRHARVLARRQADRVQPRGHRRGHTLAMMDFDAGDQDVLEPRRRRDRSGEQPRLARVHARRQVRSSTTPASNARFETDGAARRATSTSSTSRRKKTARLDALDGYSARHETYLPASDPQPELRADGAPRGGGRLLLGRLHQPPLVRQHAARRKDNGDENGKLWVAAIDIGARRRRRPEPPRLLPRRPGADADNLRGFWVLAPCRADGRRCASGDECCGGFCRRGRRRRARVRRRRPGGCSNEYEKCTTAADCCNSGDQCINGQCAVIVN